MRMLFNRFDRTTRARVLQPINKSNRFNLTTGRYGEARLAEIEADAQALGLHARPIVPLAFSMRLPRPCRRDRGGGDRDDAGQPAFYMVSGFGLMELLQCEPETTT